MNDLASQTCVPCEGDTPPLKTTRVNELLAQVDPQWHVVQPTAKGAMRVKRDFKFKNFVEAMQFVNRVAEIAEAEGHHPALHVFYNKVTIELWTHAVGGLSKNDFILAAKIDQLR